MINRSSLPSQPSRQYSLRSRLLVMLGGTLLIILMIIYRSTFVLVANAERASWQGQLSVAAKTVALQIGTYIDAAQRGLTFVASAADDDDVDEHMDQLLAANPAFLELMIVTERGQLRAHSLRTDTSVLGEDEILDSPWFIGARIVNDDRIYTSELTLDAANKPYLLMAKQGPSQDIVAAVVDMSEINTILTNNHFAQTGNTYLIEGEGQLIAHTDPEAMQQQLNLAGRPELPDVSDTNFVKSLVAANNDAYLAERDYVNFQGDEVLGVINVVNGTDWIIFTEVARSETFAQGRQRLIPLITFAILFWSGAILTTLYLFVRWIFGPMDRLSESLKAVIAGDLKVQVPVLRLDEIGIVADGFNSMVRDLEARTQAQQRAERALQESEKRYRELVENGSDIIYATDINGFFTYMSPAVVSVTGYPGNELIGKHFTEIVDPEWIPTLLNFYKKQLKGGESEVALSLPIIRANGERRWVEQKTSLVMNEQRQPIGFQSVVRDITERKQSEEKLRALYTLMAQAAPTLDEQLTEAVKIGVGIMGFDMGIISQIQGDTYTVLYGYSPDDSLKSGTTFEFHNTYCEITYQSNEFISIDHMSASPYNARSCFQIFHLEGYAGVPLEVNGERFGTLSFYSVSPRPQQIEGSERDFFLLMGKWVSGMLERKAALDALHASEANLRSILDNTPAIFIKTDQEHRIEFIRIPGVPGETLDHLTGMSYLTFIPERYHESARRAVAEAFETRTVREYELYTTHPVDGTEHWYLSKIAPIIVDDEVVSVLLVNDDITERKQSEQQIQMQNESLVKANRDLAIARKQAEAASKLKSQFLATMSHELRTPLNAVIGYTQLQLAGMAGELTTEQIGFQQRILVNAQHLLQLINEVLDLSKIEAGRMELAQRPFNLRDCLNEIMFQNKGLAEEKGLTFDLIIDDRLPQDVIGDRGRIKQIIINLISNAIKFTDEGSVTVDVALNNKETWRIMVTDTGSGISPTMQENIFDEFRQAENGIDRGGTGLGLAIVRKLVLMMGGNIRLNSEVGRGSIFTILLPFITEAESITEVLEA